MRILVADSQSKVRYALRVLVGRQPDMEIVGEAADAWELLADLKVAQADLLLLHWQLPGMIPEDLLRALSKIQPDLKVIVLSAWPEAARVALAGGAHGFVCKTDPPERLLATMRLVMPAHRETATPCSGQAQTRGGATGRRDPGLRKLSLGGRASSRHAFSRGA